LNLFLGGERDTCFVQVALRFYCHDHYLEHVQVRQKPGKDRLFIFDHSLAAARISR
jgi:hypothetical protein